MKAFKTAITLCLTLCLIYTPRAFAISIPDEQKLGNEYMEIIESQGLIIHDPVVTRMIDTVGRHIVAALPSQPFHYDFNMINDNSFNAFASPAANIFIHRGLIASLDTMDEFAGIMAHEVAHAASRHVSQSIDRAKLVTMGSLAGMLAGVLIGAAGGGGDAAQALTFGTAAAGQSAMLSFTRENETEADQKAVLFMAKTGYDPRGMLSALNKIRQSDYQGVEGIPDYFKTHPGTGSRIAHLAGILENYTPPPGKPAPPPNYDFKMVKYRVIGLYSDPATHIEKLALMLREDPDNRALNYGLGILYGRTSHLNDARTLLNKALAADPFDPMVLLELGRLNIRSGNYDSAISVLEGVTGDEVLGDLGIYYRSVAQIEAGRLTAAESGLQSILAKNKPGFAKANYHMANIMAKRQNDPMSSYYLGIYYADTGNFKNAVHHLQRAVDTLTDEKLKENAQKKLDELGKKQQARKRRG